MPWVLKWELIIILRNLICVNGCSGNPLLPRILGNKDWNEKRGGFRNAQNLTKIVRSVLNIFL